MLCPLTKSVPHSRIWPDDTRNCALCGESNSYPPTPQVPSASYTVIVLNDSPACVGTGALSNGIKSIATDNFLLN